MDRLAGSLHSSQTFKAIGPITSCKLFLFFFILVMISQLIYCLALAALLCRVLSDPTCTVNFPGKFTEGCLIVPVMLFPLGLESSKCITLYSLGFNAKD